MRHELARVDEHERAVRVRGVGERADVVDRAEHVRHRADREELRAVEQLVERREVEAEVGRERDPAQLDAAFGGEHLPRHDVGVVLHVREHDRVAGLQVGARPRVRDEVDRLGRVAGEDDLVGARRVDEAGDLAPRVLERGRGLLGDACRRRGGCWRSGCGSASSIASSTAIGFCADDAESRYTSRLPLTSRSRIGKSRLIGGDVERAHRRRLPRAVRNASKPRASTCERDLRAAGGDDAAVDEHVHDVGDEVLEQALVVRDREDAELRAGVADLGDAGRDLAQRVDVEAGVGLVEHRDVGFHHRHLQYLVALLLAAREALVEIPLLEAAVHAQALRPLDEAQADLEHREVVDALAAWRWPGARS